MEGGKQQSIHNHFFIRLDVNECPADKKKDDDDDTGKIVGIVVGSVVGGLILITIIGCLIQRARRRGSYEKV